MSEARPIVLSMMRPHFSDLAVGLWERLTVRAAIVAGSRRADRFDAFGSGSLICFPPTALFGEKAISIGNDTMIGPHRSITVGMVPDQELIGEQMLTIGHRCVIGRGSSIAAHLSVSIGDDVYFGPNVYVTDHNHSNDDPTLPVGHQVSPEREVVIGARSWLATGVVVTPGVTIGTGVSVGANSVVTRDLPDGCVAVGSPARVIS